MNHRNGQIGLMTHGIPCFRGRFSYLELRPNQSKSGFTQSSHPNLCYPYLPSPPTFWGMCSCC